MFSLDFSCNFERVRYDTDLKNEKTAINRNQPSVSRTAKKDDDETSPAYKNKPLAKTEHHEK